VKCLARGTSVSNDLPHGGDTRLQNAWSFRCRYCVNMRLLQCLAAASGSVRRLGRSETGSQVGCRECETEPATLGDLGWDQAIDVGIDVFRGQDTVNMSCRALFLAMINFWMSCLQTLCSKKYVDLVRSKEVSLGTRLGVAGAKTTSLALRH
jgi:hypothetical protein